MKKIAFLPAALLPLTLICACSRGSGGEISRERAIALARQHVTFEPGEVEAVKDVESNRPVWRVTFRGKGVSDVHPGEVMIVTLDRRTGEIVSLGMS